MTLEASVSISIFLDNLALYETSLAHFIESSKYYICLERYVIRFCQHPAVTNSLIPLYNIEISIDGPLPVRPPGTTVKYMTEHRWNNQTVFKDGMAMEICRDLTHTSYGLASISHVAESAVLQGRSLYAEEIGTRLRYGLEFQTGFAPEGAAIHVPSWLCNGILKLSTDNMTEPGYSAMGDLYDMPYTRQYTKAARPSKPNSLFVSFETLTHASKMI